MVEDIDEETGKLPEGIPAVVGIPFAIPMTGVTPNGIPITGMTPFGIPVTGIPPPGTCSSDKDSIQNRLTRVRLDSSSPISLDCRQALVPLLTQAPLRTHQSRT